MVADRNGQPMLTNEKKVYTFVSATKAYVSASLNSNPEKGSIWDVETEVDVAISGNKITVTTHPFEQTTVVEDYTITAINGSEFTANTKVTGTMDGNVIFEDDIVLRFEKVTADYSEAIIGLWECEGIYGGETFNDANGRLEFMADGTYNFYRKNDAGYWESVTTREFQDYFVDGTLVATRWKDQGEDELREWWEIESINGDDML